MLKPINTDFVVLTKNCPSVIKLLKLILANKDNDDKVFVLDDFSDEANLTAIKQLPVKLVQHKLTDDYSAHRNCILPRLKSDYSFFFDDDEQPTISLLKSYKTMIKNTDYPDLILIPRLNLFEGATPMDALRYGWDLTYINGRPVVNWQRGDYQSRLFKNRRGLKWKNRLHEQIFPGKEHKRVVLAKEMQYCIEHRKTIHEQIDDNNRYQEKWSAEENQGISNNKF